ncbi:MAG: peptide/nickel transport system permease protein [Solirubrobacteraceae bacterium]|nr:peptide/nickel transport system permease protein [Solirubrobacteraceae bacterium]
MSIAAAETQVTTARDDSGARLRRFRRLGLIEQVALGGVVVITLAAALGPLLAPESVNLPSGSPLAAPSLHHLFGTDDIGRDVFSRVIAGVRLTWLPALVVIVIAALVGGAIGLISGAVGGWTDRGLQRLTDLFLVLPSTLIAIAVIAALGPGQTHMVIAISIFWWPWYSRIVRNETRAAVARPHVEAGRLAGASRSRLLLRYILPATIPAVVITATVDVANVVLVFALFSFLGLGAPAPAPELGAMSARALSDLTIGWWIPMFPAIAVFVLALTANIAGDGLRNMLRST